MKLQHVFTPAVKTLDALKYWQKFILIGLILLSPMLGMMMKIIGTLNEQVVSDMKRLDGAAYNSLVKNFIQDLQQHRGLSVSYLGGDPSMKEQYAAKQQELAEDIRAIDELDQRVGASLQASEQWTKLKEQWLSLEESMEKRTVEEAKFVQNIYIEKLLSFMNDIADNSSLTAEESLFTMYLVQSTTRTLPELTERLGQTRADGVSVLADQHISLQERMQFNALETYVNNRLQILQRETSHMFKGKPELEGQLGALYTDAVQETTKLVDIVKNNFIYVDVPSLSSEQYFEAATQTINASFKLYDAEAAVLQTILQERIDAARTSMYVRSTLLIISGLLGIYAFIGLYMSTQRVVNVLKELTSKVADGDLTTRVSLGTKDEMRSVADAFNDMVSKLRGLIEQVGLSSEQVSASSQQLHASAEQSSQATEQVAAVVQDVATGADHQLTRVSESVRTLEELSTGIGRMAESASSMSDSSRYTMEKAEEGGRSVQVTLQQMSSIEQSVEATDAVIRLFDQKSQQIQQILSVITDIARQTNLLALNAAIEAARAGEQGRGFAVVAGEVRKLAEQSSASSSQIAALVHDIQSDMKRSVAAMVHVKGEVQEGLKVTQATSSIFKEIVAATTSMAGRIEDLAATAEEMAAGSEQVNSSAAIIAEIAGQATVSSQEAASLTEEQLASMEEIAASAAHLSSMAEELQTAVSRFKL
ncbi:methyl-accepting chemotaxis protein [Paenibacillus sp. YYML68]|uniref:methyl-accepting chemotaxis protein n=1 Tax=Paenibacillus sp. YYML68 TaxID=2909250 RepID=UPI002491CF73|nr:methyl-accepting chemotaxis protein [Paenibacillus sp. YYML68]